MNQRIKELAEQTGIPSSSTLEKFAELLIEEVRTVVDEAYQNSPLECCGFLISLDQAILKHFYGVDLDL